MSFAPRPRTFTSPGPHVKQEANDINDAFLTLLSIALTPRLVSWYGDWNSSAYPPSHSPDDLGQLGFTHVVASAGAGLLTNKTSGVVTCDRNGPRYAATAPLRAAAVKYGFKIMDLPPFPETGSDLVKGDGLKSTAWKTYLATIGAAADECGIQGGEWDYEPTIELSAAERTKLATVFANINHATSPEFETSLDILVWGFKWGRAGSDAPLDWRPYIDVEMTNAGQGPTFINTESYHWPRTSTISEYKFDAEWLTFYGVDRRRVNIGPPMYSYNNGRWDPKKHHGEPTWHTLAPFCPTIAWDGVVCDGVRTVSRQMMADLGAFIASAGWGGAFPWAADYDAVGNMSLIEPLARSMGVLRS